MSSVGGNNIKRIIGIISGKGGVGKSTVTAITACRLASMGYRIGILDGDITGPSIPRILGLHGKVLTENGRLIPAVTEEGIKVISMNLLLDDEEKPVLYRGPLITSVIRQFWNDTEWGDLDFLLVDMPPGTGDVPLTVYRELPIDGVVMVTSPQELVRMIVMKAVNMAERMNVKLLGIVENYSYFVCPDCGGKHYIFGRGNAGELAEELGTVLLAGIPFMPDGGNIRQVICDTEIILDTIIGK